MDDNLKNKFFNSISAFIGSIVESNIDERWNELKGDVREIIEEKTESFFSNLDWQEIFDDNLPGIDFAKEFKNCFDIDEVLETSHSFERVVSRINDCESAIIDVQPIKDVFYKEIESDEFKKAIKNTIYNMFKNDGSKPVIEEVMKEIVEDAKDYAKLKDELKSEKDRRILAEDEINRLMKETSYAENARLNTEVINLKAREDRSEFLDQRCKILEEENARYSLIKDQLEKIRIQDLEMQSLQKTNFEMEKQIKKLQDTNIKLLYSLSAIKKSIPDILG